MNLLNIGKDISKHILILLVICVLLFTSSNVILSEIPNIETPLAIAPQPIQPPKISRLAAAARTKRVIDEKSVFERAAVTGLKMPVADGKVTFNNDFADIDASNVSKGYIMVKVKTTDTTAYKYVRITNSNTSVNYDYLVHIFNEYITFPLTDGNGTYTVIVVDTVGTRKVVKNSATFDVVIEDSISQFLYPNYFVNFNKESKAVKMADYLCENLTTDLSKVQEIYNYVIDNITYDYELAKTNPDGRVPVIDTTITTKTGVCFDYSSLMTAMLRSVGIPTKVVSGYTGGFFHAWISVYIKDVGWVNNIIQFDGKAWKLMDPTFAASSSESSGIMEYIGDGKNYTVRYTY